MSVTRRAFVGTTLAGVAGLGLARAAFPDTTSAGLRRRQGGWDPSRLSPALMHTATAECVRVRNRASGGRLTAGDLRGLAATLRLTFAHFSEVGLPAAQERLLNEHRIDALAQVPRHDDVERVRRAMGNAGAILEHEDLVKMLSASPESKQAAVTSIERIGVQALQLRLADAVEAFAASLDARRSRGVRRVAVGGQNEEINCKAMTMIIDTLGVIVAVNGAGSLMVPALLPVAAIEGVLLAILVFIHDWFCDLPTEAIA